VDRSHPADAGADPSFAAWRCPGAGARHVQPVERRARSVRRCARSVAQRAGSVAHLACSVGRRTCSGETLRTLGRFGAPRTVGRTSRRLGRTPRTPWWGTAHALSDAAQAWSNFSRRSWPLNLL